MAASNDSQIVIKLLDAPSHALLRKFGSLGYSLLLRLQSELTAIESHSGDALLAGIDLHNVGATTVALGAEASTESRLREEELQNKLIKYCKRQKLRAVDLRVTDCQIPILNSRHASESFLKNSILQDTS